MKARICLVANPKFQLQIRFSSEYMIKNVKLIGVPENNYLCIFIIASSPRGAYFLFTLETKQEATSGWDFTKCISEVKVNQLKLKNVKMGISNFNKVFESMKNSICHCASVIFIDYIGYTCNANRIFIDYIGNTCNANPILIGGFMPWYCNKSPASLKTLTDTRPLPSW